MNIYEGKSVFHGIAIGRISVYKKGEQQVKRVKIKDAEAEIARFEESKAQAVKQLRDYMTKRYVKWGRRMQLSLKYIR